MSKLDDYNSWEDNIYAKGHQINSYPYDLVVSIVFHLFPRLSLKAISKMKVLDLGCGVGNNAKFLAENGFQVFGIDGSKTAIEICKTRFKKFGLKGEFVCDNFSKLPYKDDFFDLVIDRESLYSNDLPDMRKTLKEIHRTLKRDGKFVSFTFNSYHPDMKSGKAIGHNVYKMFKKGSVFYNTGIAHFTDWQDLLEVYSEFKLENVMRNSLTEVYNVDQRFMEYDEYIIIANKAQ
jgi:2-polyprenyl-3-methyl-5-hydroxy-6-metoxy-1,4-benzoquinol methylase